MALTKHAKMFMVLVGASILLVSLYVRPSGTSLNILTVAPSGGIELVPNPALDDNATSWHFGAWRFLNSTWAPSNWMFEENRVTMELATEPLDRSFYCITVEQHLDEIIYDKTEQYVVSWRGKMNHAKVNGVGVLGMGVNMFLDAVKNNRVTETLELYVFFYQDGFYEIPTGTYRDYGDRGTYWFEELVQEPNPDVWRFFYFHPLQLPFGETRTIHYSLNRCLDVVRREAGGDFADADCFRLTTISSVMEMLNAEGSFSTEYMNIHRLGG